jgi:hypothetical protein
VRHVPHASCHRAARERRADEPAEAEEPVERGHDRPPVSRLDRDGLRVHRYVERGVRRAQHDQRRSQEEHPRRDERQREREAERDRGRRGHAPAAEAGDEEARDRQRQHRAHRHAE